MSAVMSDADTQGLMLFHWHEPYGPSTCWVALESFEQFSDLRKKLWCFGATEVRAFPLELAQFDTGAKVALADPGTAYTQDYWNHEGWEQVYVPLEDALRTQRREVSDMELLYEDAAEILMTTSSQGHRYPQAWDGVLGPQPNRELSERNKPNNGWIFRNVNGYLGTVYDSGKVSRLP